MKTIKVWDLFVRLFHWSLVISVASQLATAEDFKTIHVRVGYFIIAMLILRILWGFIGSRYARFKDFIYPPTEILVYLKGLIHGRPRHYTGHNPAGGAMVCALLLVLVLTALTGLMTYRTNGKAPERMHAMQIVPRAWADDDNHHGGEDRTQPDELKKDRHARGPAEAQARFWKDIHETMVGIALFLIVLHVCGVIASSYVHRENLILAMITGNKKIS